MELVQIPSFMSISTMVIELCEFDMKKKKYCDTRCLAGKGSKLIFTNKSDPVLWCLNLIKLRHPLHLSNAPVQSNVQQWPIRSATLVEKRLNTKICKYNWFSLVWP